MFSLLNSIQDSISSFFTQLTDVLGFLGYLGVFVGIELLFVLLFVIKSAFSYEIRLKKILRKANNWLFENKQITEDNITEFNRLIKKGPRRLVYYWQQYILYREADPSSYMNEVNLIEKPLKTSSYQSNIKNLGLLTGIWAAVAAVFGLASQTNTGSITLQKIALGLIFALLVGIVGTVAIIILRARRVVNLDDIYHLYHYFARFTDNACAELKQYIDFNLLFTPKEIEKGNVHLREYYETRARQAKAELEKASKTNEDLTKYNFEKVGIDGAVLLERAMKESERYLNKKRDTAAEIARIEAQKDALKRNYETGQMDLQRKIQATKENIAKLIEQQAATTSRVEVGLLRNQQEKEVAKQSSLQKDYDKEEARYNSAKQELDAEVERLSKISEEGLDEATKNMESEYQSFVAKVMKSANELAQKNAKQEKEALQNEANRSEEELVNVQTQIKRLKDENDTLKALIESQKDTLRSMLEEDGTEKLNNQPTPEGHYDENGNYIYSDGSFHDTQGLFHDVDGSVYNMNGELVSKDETPEETRRREEETFNNEQLNQFGMSLSNPTNQPKVEEYVPDDEGSAPVIEPYNPFEGETNNSEPKVEPYNPFEEETVSDEPKVEPYNPFEEDGAPVVEPYAQNEETEPAPTPKVEAYNPFEEDESANPEPASDAPQQTSVIEPYNPSEEESVKPVVEPYNPFAEDEPNEVVPVKEETNNGKRGRGRPRKEDAKPKFQVEPIAKRGRPRKNKETVKEEPKKTRGRPKKEEILAKPVKSASTKSNKATQTKPKKESLTKSKQVAKKPIKLTAKPVKEEKRKPGRPAKNTDKDLKIKKATLKIDETEKALKQFEKLKKEIERAKKAGISEAEAAAFNRRLNRIGKKMSSK